MIIFIVVIAAYIVYSIEVLNYKARMLERTICPMMSTWLRELQKLDARGKIIDEALEKLKNSYPASPNSPR